MMMTEGKGQNGGEDLHQVLHRICMYTHIMEIRLTEAIF